MLEVNGKDMHILAGNQDTVFVLIAIRVGGEGKGYVLFKVFRIFESAFCGVIGYEEEVLGLGPGPEFPLIVDCIESLGMIPSSFDKFPGTSFDAQTVIFVRIKCCNAQRHLVSIDKILHFARFAIFTGLCIFKVRVLGQSRHGVGHNLELEFTACKTLDSLLVVVVGSTRFLEFCNFVGVGHIDNAIDIRLSGYLGAALNLPVDRILDCLVPVFGTDVARFEELIVVESIS